MITIWFKLTSVINKKLWNYDISKWKKMLVAQLCPTLWDPMDHSSPGSAVAGILQARTLEWVAISFSRGSSWPRDRTMVSCTAGRFFTIWATREAHNISKFKLPSWYHFTPSNIKKLKVTEIQGHTCSQFVGRNLNCCTILEINLVVSFKIKSIHFPSSRIFTSGNLPARDKVTQYIRIYV